MEKVICVYAEYQCGDISIQCTSNKFTANCAINENGFNVELCSFKLDEKFMLNSMSSVPILYEALQDMELAKSACNSFKDLIALVGIDAAINTPFKVESKYGSAE